MKDDDIPDVIAHATIVCRRHHGGPFPQALARLAELTRAHLDSLDGLRYREVSARAQYLAERDLRSALYARPTVEMAIGEPSRGPRWWLALARAWRRMRRGWRP